MYKPMGIPSSLLSEQSDSDNGIFGHKFENVTLKSGAIINVYDIDDENNITKLGPEYDVVAIEQKREKGQASTIYKNCIATDSLGAIADFVEFKRRVAEKPQEYKNKLDPDDMNGAFVLLLCLDGQSEKAVILGGLRNPNRPDVLTKDSKHHMEMEFNGVNFVVKDDGSLKIEYKSKTDNNGKYADEVAGGSYVEINKDGSITVTDGNKESFKIDKKGKTIALTAESDISATSDANVNVTAKSGINLTAQADLIAAAQGKAAITAGSQIDVKAESQIMVKSPIQMFSADSMFSVKSNLVDIKGTIVMLGAGGPPALTLQTQFLGVGNLGAPVISVPIGPFSANVFFG